MILWLGMSFSDLHEVSHIGNTRCMRLPQPSIQSLSALVIFLMMILPFAVQAAAQQLTCSPTSLQFGTVLVGQSETLLVELSNKGQSSVTISKVSTSNYSFKILNFTTPHVLPAGQSLEVSVEFVPLGPGNVNGGITFVSNASDANLTLNVSGDAVSSETVSANPASVSFGSVNVGSSSTLPVVLTNNKTKSVTITSQQTTGSAFSVSGAKFPLTLGGGQKLTLNVTFDPRVAGLTGGSSFISGPGLTIPFRGTGTAVVQAELAVSPATLNFGNVAVGENGMVTAELIASGASVTISSVSSGSSQFAVANGKFPLTIPAGKNAYLNVTFTPKTSGKSSGTLTFVSNAADDPTAESVTGTGTTPYVTLSWNASNSPEVMGYNVYRKTTGSYSKLNSKLDAQTTYADTSVASGATYYYATTAVNSSGKESALSSSVEVTVP